jgi:DNA-nicking Smr family endonuclease
VKESASSFSKGRLRRLSAEEIALWLAVAKTVSPRPSRVLPQAPAAPARNEVQAEQPAAPGAAKPPEKPKAAKPNQNQPALARKIPPLEPLERKLRQKLSRGRIGPDAAIDLHGLTRHEACVVLRQFLTQAQREGAKLVLVVTGKGRGAGAGGLFEDETAGVLRRSVPQWLRGPDYHSIVVGFEEASRPHGGAGALYVRLRRRRPLPE